MTNVQRLVVYRMRLDAVPHGRNVKDALAYLQDKERISVSGQVAIAWVSSMLQAVRKAEEPNPWKDADDESISGEILRRIKEKEAKGISEK